MAVFDLPKILYPGLSVPGEKPNSNVEIDERTPLSDGLIVCIPFLQHSGIDLVSGKRLTIGGGTHWRPKGQYFDEDGDYLILPSVTLTPGLSLASKLVDANDVGSGFSYWISFGTLGAANTLNMYLQRNGGPFWSNSSGAANTFVSWSSVANNKAVSIDSNGGIYINGLLHSSGSYSSVSATRDLYIGGRSDLNSERFYGGLLPYLYIWSRAITPNEHLSISRNPYQILKPVSPTVFFTSAAAPAATSQPPQQTRKHYMKLLRL